MFERESVCVCVCVYDCASGDKRMCKHLNIRSKVSVYLRTNRKGILRITVAYQYISWTQLWLDLGAAVSRIATATA